VVVAGWNEAFFDDKSATKDWLIFFEDDMIVSAEPDDGRYEFTNPDDYGIVLEE
jgi:hypothetical protein